MLENGKLPAGAPAGAEGRVTLEYTDGLTGRVKERVEGKNHVFSGGMMLGGLPYLLGWNESSSRSTLAIYLSDYAGALDTEIPLIPGNIIGYGTIGSAASGKYLGVENTAARSLGMYSAGKFHYKRQWSWAPNQVPGTIRKIGLSPRLTEIATNYYNNMLFSPLPITFSGAGLGICNYDDGLYTVTRDVDYAPANVLATQYFFGRSAPTKITWSQLLEIDDYYYPLNSRYGSAICCFIDPGTRDMHLFYIYQSSELSEGRNLYKLLHAWFDAALSQRKGRETTAIGTTIDAPYGFSQYPISKGSAEFGLCLDGGFYLPYGPEGSSAWYQFDPDRAGGGSFTACLTKRSEGLVNCSYSTSPDFGHIEYYDCCVAVLGGRAAVQMITRVPSTMTISHQFKAGEADPYAAKMFKYNTYQGMIPRSIGGASVLAAYTQGGAGAGYVDGGETWSNYSDLCCYALPADAPARQEGQGVSVTYELAVGY